MKILLDECAKNLPYPLLWRGIKGEVKKKHRFLEMPLTLNFTRLS